MPRLSPVQRRRLFTVNAVLAWSGLALSMLFNIIDYYPPTAGLAPSRYGPGNPAGPAGIGARLADWISYFTTLSNIVAAVVATALASGRARDTPFWRALRLDSLVMTTITAVVYAVLIAPTSVQQGWDNVSNSLIHQVTPALTVLAWILAGPRGWVGWRTVLPSLVVPIGWIVWMLGRGLIVRAYPYDFVDAIALGYPKAVGNVTGILGVGIVLAVLFVLIERLVARLTAQPHVIR